MSDNKGGYDIAIGSGKRRQKDSKNTLLLAIEMLSEELAKTKAELKLAYDQLDAAMNAGDMSHTIPVLRPLVKPDSFTIEELQEAIREVRAEAKERRNER